eukprot:11814115-Heterocapsa_arctica.AAC.1
MAPGSHPRSTCQEEATREARGEERRGEMPQDIQDRWSAWNANPRKMSEEAERTAGIPPGSVQFGSSMFFRMPDNDWLFDPGWVPTGEAWPNLGRSYLTNSSPHARAVYEAQMEVIREMAAARSLPDGWDGPTLRQ